MSPNTDNATSRLLFAILKQKSLKDIDWNLVAQDPVLLQPIANGHAARMRYARFKATVLGNEQSKKSRVGDKGGIQKPGKKGNQAKKDNIIKSESNVSLSSYAAQFSPSSMASPYTVDNEDLSARFLTPCSDDMTAMFAQPTVGDSMNHVGREERLNPNSPAYSAFEAAFDIGGYRMAAPVQQGMDLLDFSNGQQNLADFGSAWSDRINHF
ncbi:hypothetical protein S40288_05028 [Stachybotrys chartarum IBT 40288]|nr:hypothetical protein S40288_05028 [Stachybotrys chartarum IBT 40288]